MLRKSWLLHLEFIKIQFIATFKGSKEAMSSVSYLPFSELSTRHPTWLPEKVSQGLD